VLLKAQAIATGGYFLDFTVDREVAARYGLRVQDVNHIIESAIGGNTIAMTVEGRERFQSTCATGAISGMTSIPSSEC
jgi:Cu/Ag efflux pump CusA